MHQNLFNCIKRSEKSEEFPGGPVVMAFTVFTWVQSLDGELRSRKLCGMAEKKAEELK